MFQPYLVKKGRRSCTVWLHSKNLKKAEELCRTFQRFLKSSKCYTVLWSDTWRWDGDIKQPIYSPCTKEIQVEYRTQHAINPTEPTDIDRGYYGDTAPQHRTNPTLLNKTNKNKFWERITRKCEGQEKKNQRMKTIYN